MQTFRTVKREESGNLLSSALIIALMYLYIFQPPIISKYVFLGIELIIFLTFQCIHKFKPLKVFYINFNVEINVLIVLVIYAILRDLIGGENVYSSRMAYFTFQAFYFSGFLIWKFKDRDIEQKLLYTGILGSLVTITMMVNPQINSVISNYMKDELASYENFEIRYRGYGFSENITFTYSYVLGICAGLCLLKTQNKLIYAFPFITCLIGVAFNARIGFVPIIITICYSIFVAKDIRHIFKLIFGIILVCCCIYYLWEEQIELYKETSWIWISSFFYEFSDFLFGTSLQTQGSTFNNLAGSFIIFPERISEWIFGSGKSIYLESEGNNSDIGYILQLNYGGLIFLSLICFFIVYTVLRYWNKNKLTWFSVIFIISVVLLNYKGFFFAGTPGARFIYLLYTWGILRKRFKLKLNN